MKREKQQCSYVFSRGQKSGQQCTSRTVNEAGRCKVHAASRDTKPIPDLSNDKIFGDVQPVEPSASKSSVYTVTINSNRAYDKADDDFKKTFKSFVEYVFSDQIYDYFTDFASEDPRANVVETKFDHRFEIGEKTGLLHAHGIIDIAHNGHFKFRVNDLRALALEIFGQNIYINCPVSSRSDMAWTNYMKKHDKAIAI